MQHPQQLPCVVVCDYPIKAMSYMKLLANLGETQIHVLESPDLSEAHELSHAKLVILDINILPQDEERIHGRWLNCFKHAHFLVMQEDHSELEVRLDSNRDVCFLGKQAPLQMAKHLLGELLYQGRRHLSGTIIEGIKAGAIRNAVTKLAKPQHAPSFKHVAMG